MYPNRKRGFTLIEFFGVSVIIVILSAIVTASISSFRSSSYISLAKDDIVSLLNNARNSTLSSVGDDVHGLHFDSTSVVSFKGSTYDSQDPLNVVTYLPENIEVTDISLYGDGYEVIFNRLTGETDQFGTVTITDISKPSRQKSVTILSTGLVE